MVEMIEKLPLMVEEAKEKTDWNILYLDCLHDKVKIGLKMDGIKRLG